MQPCDREGVFKATITEYGLSEMESGAVGVNIRASLLSMWKPGEDYWEDWAQYEMEAEGTIWILKKDNKGPNDLGVKSLIEFAGWDGDVASITNATWQTLPCQVVVKRDEYNGQTRYKIAFINAVDQVPGGLNRVSPDRAKALSTQYGSQFRAIAANVSRNKSSAIPGVPATPPAPPPAPAPAVTPGTHPSQVQGDNIPF